MKKPDFAEIHARVRTLQSGKRFAHTEGVVKEAEYIAKACGFSTEFVEKARVAALLHDITKNLTDEEQEKLFLKYAIDIPSGPATMHEKTGAHFARELFGAEAVDEEIFSAIFCHTTGKAGMSAFDMVIFIADFTEETREHKSCRDMRAYLHAECEKLNGESEKAEALLRNVTLKIIGDTLNFLTLKKRKIDLRTVEAWNFLAE
ncbi:MAG: HD domain-containing protein [Clostridia bacterium]|nr:HD domain-containing protein [Clostridia bacterium]MBQ8861363.1 HD domain-containing protein [Clostridia bacterium]